MAAEPTAVEPRCSDADAEKADLIGAASASDAAADAEGAGKPVDHWWGIVVAWMVFTVQFFLYGTMNSYSVFSHLMQLDERLGRPSGTAVSFGNSVANGVAPILSIFAGAICDRVGPKIVLGVAGLLAGIGWFFATFATSVTMLVAIYSIPVCVASACLSTPGSTAVSSWLRQRLSIGMGIAYAGNGAGSSVIVFVAGYLAERPNADWRVAFRWMAIFPCIALAAALVTSFRVPPNPRPVLSPGERAFLKQLFTSGVFWTLAGAGALFSFTFFAVLYIIVPYGSSLGRANSPYEHVAPVSVAQAATLFTFFGVLKFIGSLTLGLVANRTEARLVYACAAGMTALACCFWGLAHTFVAHAVVCSVLGFTFAGMFCTLPSMAARCYAGPFAGLGIGCVMASFAVGGFGGPTVVTAIKEHLSDGSYSLACGILGASSMASGLLILVGGRDGRIAAQPFAQPFLPDHDDCAGEAEEEAMLTASPGCAAAEAPKAGDYGAA